jgi:hypothetical protein
MKNFIVIYNTPADAPDMMANATPEQMAEGMKPWMAWKDSLGSKLVEMGAPLAKGVRLLPNGGTGTCKTEVSGYSIIQANNIEEAKSLLQGHPHLAWLENCSIDIHETFSM